MTKTASPPDPMRPHPYRIRRRQQETEDTFTFELEPANGSPLMRFRPGQFNMLYLFGVGEVPISISGDPARPERLIHTTRAVGTVTRAMERLGHGQMMGIRGPFGSGWPVEAAENHDIVIVAGGIGLAPLRPAIYTLLTNRERYGRVVLLYGARTPQDLLYTAELHNWRSRFDLEVEVTVDRAGRDWRGRVGVVTPLIARAAFDADETTAMICGPEIMMHYAALELQKRGVPDEHIYLSMERNMKCATGFCGHCQFGPTFVCRDGPVFRFDQIQPWFRLREV